MSIKKLPRDVRIIAGKVPGKMDFYWRVEVASVSPRNRFVKDWELVQGSVHESTMSAAMSSAFAAWTQETRRG